MSGSELVVGVDGSAGALAAVRWAARVARERRRGLRLVHALPELPAPYPRADPTYEQLLEAAAGQGRTMLAEARTAASDVEANPPVGGGTAPALPGAATGVTHQVFAKPEADRLASTGVGVGWLALGGLLTFSAGVALVLGTRRRAH